MTIYPLRKSLKIFRSVFHLYRKKRKTLPDFKKKEIVNTLSSLQEELLHRDREQASRYARAAQIWAKNHLSRSFIEKMRHLVCSFALALLVAMLVRSIWFELYEIPTGSMRPTLREKDRLVVSKTAFGINIPFYAGHFSFDPNLMQRLGTVIFRSEGIDLPNLTTRYFHLFPGKKQFVKRLIGKPGDTLYFYGGQIYGMDQYRLDISSDLQKKELSKIDHVPYISFNGRVNLPSKAKNGMYSPAVLSQMNQKVARLSIDSYGRARGNLLEPYRSNIKDYYELWGFNTYGMARVLTKQEVSKFTDTSLDQLEDAPLYMEIFHHPSVKHPTIQTDQSGRPFPGVGLSRAVLPLKNEHLKTLMHHLYTSRFTVEEGMASRFDRLLKAGSACRVCVPLPGVPDGTYEFYYGKGYQIHFGGIAQQLAPDHPLYAFSPERFQTLFNLGIEWINPMRSNEKEPILFPSRYVYYRNKNLYALGSLFMKKEDPTLLRFIENEYLKEQNSPAYRPYLAFDDAPPPKEKDGKINKEFLEQYGITVPAGHYLVLGDNYAMSADSRDFGFVPESSIRGAPVWIFWPPGNRFGGVLQMAHPLFNFPRIIVWSLAFALICTGAFHYYKRTHLKLPVQIDD